jgi:hypothetical protein
LVLLIQQSGLVRPRGDFYSKVAISLGVNPLPYGKIAFQALSLTTLRRGYSYHCGSASDTLAQFRGLAISLRARLQEIT